MSHHREHLPKTPTVTLVARLLLAFSALLSAVGGAIHAAAFRRTLAAVATSNLSPFFGNSFMVLWLEDSCILFILAAVFGYIAVRPSAATKPVAVLLALIPAATAVLLYIFLGGFFAGHLLLAVAAMAFFAGLRFPAQVEAEAMTVKGPSSAMDI